MGFSISGGVRFNTTDIFEINQHLMTWREVMKDLTRIKMLEYFCDHALRAIDDAAGRGKEIPESPLGGAWGKLLDAQREIKKTGHRNPECDFDFEVSLLPYDGQVYGIVRCEHREWRQKFMRTGWVKSHYWHDDEKPSSITRKEWNQRETIWRGIFEKDSRPIANGFDAVCTAETYSVRRITKAEIAKRLAREPFDQRLHRVARQIVIDRRVFLDPNFTPEKRAAGEHFISTIYRATDWLKSDHGQVALELEKASIAKLLPLVITEAML